MLTSHDLADQIKTPPHLGWERHEGKGWQGHPRGGSAHTWWHTEANNASPAVAASVSLSSPEFWGRVALHSFPIGHLPVRRPWPQSYTFALATATGSVWLPPAQLTQPWSAWSVCRKLLATWTILSNHRAGELWGNLFFFSPVNWGPEVPTSLSFQGGYQNIWATFGVPQSSTAPMATCPLQEAKNMPTFTLCASCPILLRHRGHLALICKMKIVSPRQRLLKLAWQAGPLRPARLPTQLTSWCLAALASVSPCLVCISPGVQLPCQASYPQACSGVTPRPPA